MPHTDEPVRNHPPRIIVADDDEDLRALMVATLCDDGYDVIEARDGVELAERIDVALDAPDGLPDIVVTDVRMPQLSGLGVLSALRRAQIAMPIIVITAFADDSVRMLARRLGAIDVIAKPFHIDDLRTAVMNAPVAYAERRAQRGLGQWRPSIPRSSLR